MWRDFFFSKRRCDQKKTLKTHYDAESAKNSGRETKCNKELIKKNCWDFL